MGTIYEQTATDFRNQAAFLRGLAETVRAYNEKPGYKIGMDWLIKELEQAAEECEQEAEGYGK